MRWTRSRIYAVVGFVAVSGLALVVLPALGDSHPDAVRLHLGTDGRYFEYEGTYQNLTTTGCVVNELGGPVISLDANRKVGLDSLGIGVKSGGAQGTPCGRVDTTESLTLSVPGSGILEGRFFDGLRLDLELKGNARVIATLYNGTSSRVFELGSGSSIEGGDETAETVDDGVFTAVSTDAQRNVACGAQSDSGPDAGARDNCLWTIDTDFEFNRIVLSAEVGEFSLEGSGDYGSDSAFDSLFHVANAAPVANDDTAVTNEDSSISTPTDFDVLSNDTDADGGSLTVSGVDVTGTKGTVTLSGSGEITYDPNGQFESLNDGETASDTFGYTVTDGTDTDTATVTVTINGVKDVPVAAHDAAVTNEDSSISTPTDFDVLSNDTDADGDTLTVSGVDVTGTKGTVTLSGSGEITYDPNGQFESLNDGETASDTFGYTVTDGTDTDTATVTVTINGVSDAPVAADDEGFIDSATTPFIDIYVLANDTDVDSSNLTVSGVDTTGTSGTVTIALDSLSIRYEPKDADFTGTDTFTYTVSDGVRTDTATVTVHELFECGESLSVSDGTISATYERLNAGGCDGKPYSLDIEEIPNSGLAVLFQPRPQSGTAVSDCSSTPAFCDAEFKATLSFGPEGEANAPYTGTLQYDPVAQTDPDAVALRPMKWCEFDPFGESVTDRRAALPTGESWCIVEVNIVIYDATRTATEWITYGIGDPWKIAT